MTGLKPLVKTPLRERWKCLLRDSSTEYGRTHGRDTRIVKLRCSKRFTIRASSPKDDGNGGRRSQGEMRTGEGRGSFSERRSGRNNKTNWAHVGKCNMTRVGSSRKAPHISRGDGSYRGASYCSNKVSRWISNIIGCLF